MADEDLWADAEIIHVYTRRQAIADGMLHDVTELAQEAGFRVPVALTAAAWADCVAWDGSGVQDETGRLWDVVWMTYAAARRGGPHVNEVTVELYRVPNTPDATRAELAKLVAHCGPGDAAEPVITIMVPGED